MNDTKFAEMVDILVFFRDNGIRQSGKDLTKVLRFQDIIGTSSNDDIIIMWNSQLEDAFKRLFIWAVVSTCGYEMASNVIDKTMGLDAKKRIKAGLKEEFDYLEAETIKLSEERNAFEREKTEMMFIKNKHNQILEILKK